MTGSTYLVACLLFHAFFFTAMYSLLVKDMYKSTCYTIYMYMYTVHCECTYFLLEYVMYMYYNSFVKCSKCFHLGPRYSVCMVVTCTLYIAC